MQLGAERRKRGAWFTPPDLAASLVGIAADRWSGVGEPSVCDPCMGEGVFLHAARQRFPKGALAGADIHGPSVEAAARSLGKAELRLGDGLDPATFSRPFDLVITNPPFLSQLTLDTARDAQRRADLRGWYGEAAGGYVDEVALFVLAIATRMLRTNGVAVVIVPEAMLATRSAAAVRQAVGEVCDIELVWRDTDRVFDTVPACAIALRRRQAPSAHPMASQPATADWAHLLADEVPQVDTEGPVLSTIATATADFRDAYYLVARHATEDDGRGHPRITPVGLIDPAHHRWGERRVRFAKRHWDRPVAAGLPRTFLERRLGEKLLIATQTRALEVLVDHEGNLLPTTPAITLRTARPWHVGAALTSPVLTAVAARRHSGAARARGALKLSAKQVLQLPLPLHESDDWDAAAAAFRSAHQGSRSQLIEECGRLMCRAYGADESLMDWWLPRLPAQRPQSP